FSNGTLSGHRDQPFITWPCADQHDATHRSLARLLTRGRLWRLAQASEDESLGGIDIAGFNVRNDVLADRRLPGVSSWIQSFATRNLADRPQQNGQLPIGRGNDLLDAMSQVACQRWALAARGDRDLHVIPPHDRWHD